eukprot:3539472-Prymnesium_polylepis.1
MPTTTCCQSPMPTPTSLRPAARVRRKGSILIDDTDDARTAVLIGPIAIPHRETVNTHDDPGPGGTANWAEENGFL